MLPSKGNQRSVTSYSYGIRYIYVKSPQHGKLLYVSIGKVWREDSVAVFGYDGLKSKKKSIGAFFLTHGLLQIQKNLLI